ncbi:MAG: hypothetical protein ABEJ89_10085 [Haloarculaceae archaeon]
MSDTDSRKQATSGRTRRELLRRAGAASAALAVGVSARAQPDRGNDCDAVVDASGGGDFETLQRAVASASPGETLCLEPGTYGGPVEVDVPDLRVRARRPHSSLVTGSTDRTGAAVSVTADGVTLSGLAVSHPEGLLGVAVASGRDRVTVRDTAVRDVGPVGRLGAAGIRCGGGHEDLTLVGNRVDGVANAVDERSGYPTANGVVVAGDGELSRATVANNVIRAVRSDVAAVGLLLGVDATGVAVRNNVVRGLSATPENDPDGTDDAVSLERTFAQGIAVGGATERVALRRNVVADVTASYYAGTGLRVDGSAAGLTATHNDLLAPVGVHNAGDAALEATCNYWGDPDGPRPVMSEQPIRDSQGRTAVVGPVEYDPWLVRSFRGSTDRRTACRGTDRDRQ